MRESGTSRAQLTICEEIGRKIKKARVKLGMTGKQLAERAGLSQGQLSRLESGKQGLRSDTLLRIADALGVKPSCFFMDEKNPGPYPVNWLGLSEQLLKALRLPEFVPTMDRLAEAFLSESDSFLAIKLVLDAVVGTPRADPARSVRA